MRALFALIAVAILLFGCAAQQPAPEQQKAPEQKPLPPPVQKIKTAIPQQTPQENEQETQPQPEKPPITGQQPPQNQQGNQTRPPGGNNQQPSPQQWQEISDEILDNPSLLGPANPKEKSTNIKECCSHPYYHKVYRAFSSDGISWQKEGKLIADHASVPAIMQRDDGAFILYYVDGVYDTLGCRISQDGNTFTEANCTIYGFPQKSAWDPYVVKLGNGRYRLFFFAPSPGLSNDNVILSAVSKDGINWVIEGGVRFSHSQIYDPAVINTGSGWWMFAGYNPESSPGSFPEPKIVSAKSSDGITFAREAVLDFGGNVPEIVKLDDGRYALYYCGMGGIAMSTSSDGKSWSSGTTALPADQGKVTCDPSIIKMKDGRWVMYYKTQEARMQ